MKKFFFKLNSYNKLELVKGCPTDVRDYNGDGDIDQDDQDYYDGYVDGYYGHEDDLEHSDAYYMGKGDGGDDINGDVLKFDYDGPDINKDGFVALGAYY